MKASVSARDLEIEMSNTRHKFFEESRFDPSNQKFGLFSYTGTLAIADKPYFTKTQSRKAQDGTVTTRPRNFLTNNTKRGKTPNVYFSYPAYISEGAAKPKKQVKPQTSRPGYANDSKWKPGGPIQEPPSLYPHEASETFRKINKRGPDGAVELEPHNLYTSPPRLGSAAVTPGLLIGGNKYEYLSEPYDRQHKMQLEEIKKQKAKMQEEAFKPPNPSGRPFADNIKTYGEVPMGKKVIKSSSFSGMKHDLPFVPSNPSKLGSTIGKYPEHMADPISSPKRRPPSEQTPWRPTTNHRTKPSPSVTNLASNLRSEYPILRKNR